MSATLTSSEDLRSARELVDLADAIGREIAAPNAADVDRWGRFPHETFEALRAERLLSLLVPVEHGGPGVPIPEVARVVEALAQHCGSSGLIYAMHHIQVASLARHARTPWLNEQLTAIARDELLLGSATTEKGTGGDVSSSICSVERTGTTFHLRKDAPVISYGEHCDAILVTARRTPESPASDQVIVVVPTGTCTLERTSDWDTLGFRGTCSHGYLLEATGDVDQIVDDPYAEISARTMLPTTHILWASVWLGIARQAVAKARLHLRTEARRSPDTTPAGAPAVAELVGQLEMFSALVHQAACDYQAALDRDDIGLLTSMGFAVRMNLLKTTASSLVVEMVGKAMATSGLAAYQEHGPVSLGLALRDAHGAALMIHNNRILANTGRMLLVHKEH